MHLEDLDLDQKNKPRIVYTASSDDEMIIFLHDWARSLDNDYIRRVADRFSELASNSKRLYANSKKV
jgi:hypothetical protein